MLVFSSFLSFLLNNTSNKLPIFISTDTNSEHGGWKVDGRTEVAVLSRVLNRRVHSEDRMAVYYADIAELKKVIPGLIFTVFLP